MGMITIKIDGTFHRIKEKVGFKVEESKTVDTVLDCIAQSTGLPHDGQGTVLTSHYCVSGYPEARTRNQPPEFPVRTFR